MIESKAVWKSGIINRQRPLEAIDIKLNGSRKLYLAVSAVENIDWDHANWIDPVLHKGNDMISLTTLKWKKATAGWGKPRLNRSVSGGDLIVDGKKYELGLGVHANSVIEYEIPEGVDRFTAMAGLDKAGADQNVGATVRFLVFTEQPSGPEPPSSAKIEIDLKALGLQSCKVQDLWSGKPLGVYTDKFSVSINSHGAGLYRLSSVKK
jgi:alpha-galactosidase